MGAPEFALLLGFAVVKMAIGLTLIWLGFRGGETGDADDEFSRGEPEPGPTPGPPPVRLRARPHRRTESAARGRPTRAPARSARRPERV